MIVMRIASFLVVLACASVKCEAYKILAVVGFPSFSHQRAYTNLWRQLSLKGHDVTVLTTNPLREKDLTNLTEIDISEGYAFLEEKHDWSRYLVRTENPVKFSQTLIDIRHDLVDFYLRLPQVQALINDKSRHFDVVLVETMVSQLLILGEIFDAPTITLSSFDPTAITHVFAGNPWNPIVYPDILFPFPRPFNFLHRVITTVMTNIFKYQVSQAEATNKLLSRHFPNSTETMENLRNKVSFHFTAVNPLLLIPRPHSAQYVVIGGNTRMEETQPLNKDIKDFLDSAQDGFVYFSLGSNVKSELFGTEFMQSISEVLSQLPYKVLWKTMDTKLNVSSNVKIARWVPQRYVLKHHNAKVFVTQGGIQSIEEAIMSEVPMVGVPIFGDQEYNVIGLSTRGIIKGVSYEADNFREQLKSAIVEVFSNKEYKHKIVKFNELSQDQLVSGTEKAIWHIEYTVRRKGDVSHLENILAKNIPWYQYFLLDVMAFLLSLILAAVLFVWLAVKLARKLVLRILFGKAPHDKTE